MRRYGAHGRDDRVKLPPCVVTAIQALHPNAAGVPYTPYDFDGLDIDLEEQYARWAGSVAWGTQ